MPGPGLASLLPKAHRLHDERHERVGRDQRQQERRHDYQRGTQGYPADIGAIGQWWRRLRRRIRRFWNQHMGQRRPQHR
ncbi:hypothetical protein D3C79_1006350 [compost metagenome]